MFDLKAFIDDANSMMKRINNFYSLMEKITLFKIKIKSFDYMDAKLDEIKRRDILDVINKTISDYNNLAGVLIDFNLINPISNQKPRKINSIIGLDTVRIIDLKKLSNNIFSEINNGLSEIDDILKLQDIKKEEMNGDI